MACVCAYCFDINLRSFSQHGRSHFKTKVNMNYVSCVCISCYSLMSIPLTLYICLGHEDVHNVLI